MYDCNVITGPIELVKPGGGGKVIGLGVKLCGTRQSQRLPISGAACSEKLRGEGRLFVRAGVREGRIAWSPMEHQSDCGDEL